LFFSPDPADLPLFYCAHPQLLSMDRIDRLQQAILQFRHERDWEQFHSPRDLAMSLNVEAGELLDLFLWQRDPQQERPEDLRDELADVLYSALLLAADLGLDVEEIVMAKLAKNAEKYPVGQARGNNRKYDPKEE
jgi:NTP pyrophosphatase (non-canonical NTP hydrolase)